MLQYAVPAAPQLRLPHTVFEDRLNRLPVIALPEHQRTYSHNLAQPPSTTAQYPVLHLHRANSSESGSIPSSTHSIQQLPGLSTLASLAANASAMGPVDGSTRSSTPNSMNQTQYSNAATAGGQQNGPPVCQNCSTSTTPLWRRDESGSVLCNACGLFLKLHGRPRPISLKTDVIKSRNRVKTSQPRKRESIDGQTLPNSYPAAHPDVASVGFHNYNHAPAHGQHIAVGDPNSISRSNTPGFPTQHNPNIAPQHIFDTVSLTSDTFASPSLPAFALRHPSPSASSVNGNATHLDPPQSFDALQTQHAHLRTRVSELEVINDLFRGRVAELEHNEQDARRAEQMKDEEVERYKADLDTANAKIAEMQQRLTELENQSTPARKRTRRTAAEEVNEVNTEKEAL